MSKVLITTTPFGDKNRLPIELLEAAGIEYLINPLRRKLKEEELVEMVSDFDALIAGTEPITDKVMSAAEAEVSAVVDANGGYNSKAAKAALRKRCKALGDPTA